MLPPTFAPRLLASVVKFRLRSACKSAFAKWVRPPKRSPAGAGVTVFISNLNTRHAVELTLRSLFRHTAYSNLRVVVADNASTDGSREFLSAFAAGRPMTVILAAAAQPHSAWLDQMLKTCETEYLFAVDSDMLFLGGDPIGEMVDVMERDPDLYLLTPDLQPFRSGIVEPVGGAVVDQSVSPFTWLMCVRCSLRDRVPTSFAVVVELTGGTDGRPLVNDTGACLLRDMRAASAKYGVMPRWFASRFEHLGSMSWTPTSVPDQLTPHGFMRRYKAADAVRRNARLRAKGAV